MKVWRITETVRTGGRVTYIRAPTADAARAALVLLDDTAETMPADLAVLHTGASVVVDEIHWCSQLAGSDL